MTHLDVFELATRDHERHRRLVEEASAATDLGSRARRARRLQIHLRRHSKCERASLLAPLLLEDELRPLARRATAMHLELDRLSSELIMAVFEDGLFDRTARRYRATFHEYVRFLETELYPAAALFVEEGHEPRFVARFALAQAAHIDER